MQSTTTNTTCRRCSAEIPEKRIAHCRRLGVEPAGCSTRCSRTLAQRAYLARERAQDGGVSGETNRAIVAAIVTAALEEAANDARQQYFETSRSYKKGQRGRITALAV